MGGRLRVKVVGRGFFCLAWFGFCGDGGGSRLML